MAILQRESRAFPGGCARCHKPGKSIRKKADRYMKASGGFRESFLQLEARIKTPIPGVSQAEEEELYKDCAKIYHDSRIKQHSCMFSEARENPEDSKELKDFFQDFGPKGDEAKAAVKRLAERDKQTSSRLPILGGFLALLAVTLFLVRARLKHA